MVEEVIHTRTRTINGRQALEQAILARNKRHFSQSYTDGTPWTTAPLSQIGATSNFRLNEDDNGYTIGPPDSAFLETRTLFN